VKLTIKWHLTIPGQVVNNFVLSFEDKDSEDVSFVVAETEVSLELSESDF